MLNKKRANIFGKPALLIKGLGNYSLEDTFECGQAFRFVRTYPPCENEAYPGEKEYESYVEYMTVVGDRLIFVGQRNKDELIFFCDEDEKFEELCIRYFDVEREYGKINESIKEAMDSDFLRNAAEYAAGIRILRQDPWETLFSFIISQNNNIPRIKKIIKTISLAYGENVAQTLGLRCCPLQRDLKCKNGVKLNTDKCERCGLCYSFPTAERVVEKPELLLSANPGFRYKYLVDAAEKVSSGAISLEKIESMGSYEYTLSELMKIKGVGEKVASCTALFAFGNYDAFPIDVWMRRAIDEYFDGQLDPKQLGSYAGVAQQYIFHYIRKITAAK